MRIIFPFLLVGLTSAGASSFNNFTTLYFINIGYTFSFIGLMVSLFNISVSLSELPFSILFDRYSSKLSVLIGIVTRIIAFTLFASAFSPNIMLLAQILAGIATAAMSGTLVALVFNEIEVQNYLNMREASSKLNLISNIGSLIGGTLGAIGFYFFPPSIWILAIVFFGIGALIVFFFYDKEAEGGGESLHDMALNIAKITRFRSSYLFILVNAAAVAPVILWPAKFGVNSLGFVVVGFYIITTASLFAGRIVKWLDLQPNHLKWSALVNVLCVLVFAYTENFYWALVAFSVMTLAHITLTIQISSLFHSVVENKVRASSTSVISLADSLIVALFAPVAGFTADHISVSAGISLSACLYIIIFAVSISKNSTSSSDDAHE